MSLYLQCSGNTQLWLADTGWVTFTSSQKILNMKERRVPFSAILYEARHWKLSQLPWWSTCLAIGCVGLSSGEEKNIFLRKNYIWHKNTLRTKYTLRVDIFSPFRFSLLRVLSYLDRSFLKKWCLKAINRYIICITNSP